MLKNLFAALFGYKKKTLPEPARTETRSPDRPVNPLVPRMVQPLQQPRASTPTARSSSSNRPFKADDSLSNPANPLNPLNPIHHNSFDHSSPSRCDDSHRSSWGSSSDCSSSSSSSSSSDSSSSCSSSCD